MTITPLDKEYPIAIDAQNSPMFHELVQHWEGYAKTVVGVEQHYYEEIISLTVTKRHVVSIEPGKAVERYGSKIHEAIDHYNSGGVFSGSFDILPWDDDKRIDNTITNWDSWYREEAVRKVYLRRTRFFFKLVWAAYKTARES